MEVGLSSACFYPKVETENSIKLMSSLGFKCGEIFLNSPCEYEEEITDLILKNKYEYEFDILSVHSFTAGFEPFLFDRYKRRRTDMIKYFKSVCKAGKKLGAKSYTFHGLRIIDFNEENLDLIIDVYNSLAYTACEEGIKLSQENVSWCMSSQLTFLQLLKESLNYPIYFTLDLKQAYKAEKDPLDYINVMSEALVNLHINDKNDDNVCLLPGKGNVDYERFFSKLKEVHYNENAIIEVYSNNYKEYSELTLAKEKIQSFL